MFLTLFAAAAIVAGLEDYGELTLVDEVVCATDTAHEFRQYPANGSYVTNILGSACRAMNHVNGTASFFSYRIGQGKGLVPGDMYLLTAEYPDDVPRTATLLNRAMSSRNGFHTGWSVGDTLDSVVIPQTHPESMNVPLSGEYQQIEQLMILNEKVFPYNSNNSDELVSSVTSGFDVIFQLFYKSNALDSAGIALRSIKLYHVEDESAQAAVINYPRDAPRRYVTWREEMSQESGYAMNADRYQNARIKVRLMKALGFNCFSRDMLEFGYNQNWDVTCGGKYPNNSWYWNTDDDYSSELEIYGAAGVYMLPYYEYSGSRGPSGLGVNAARKAVPLWDSINPATHFNKFVQGSNGASGANVDLTDSAAYDDFRRILECTMVRYRGQANFVGAWIRNRGSMPMSFSDNTLARFNADKGYTGGNAFTRESILAAQKAFGTSGDANRDINALCNFCPEYIEYRKWWYERRAEFFSDMQMYLETNGLAGAKLLYSGVGDESGPTLREGTWFNEYYEGIGCIDTSWGACGCPKPARSFGVMAGAYRDYGLHRDTWTYYPYEYNHAAPMGDPYNYTNRLNVAIAYPYNTCYSVGAPGMGDEYRNGSGDVFFTRHYCLYERCNDNESGNELNGYFTCEMDRAGRAIMLPELYAVAYQDPTIIGFLQGCHLARNFTRPVREFNENYLSLPAVKGRVLQGGQWGSDLTIRKYEVNGDEYYAVVNLSGSAVASGCHYFTDTEGTFTVYETVSGEAHTVGGGYMRFEMEPYQLKCFSTVNPGGEVVKSIELGDVSASVTTNGTTATISVNVTKAQNVSATVTLSLNGEVIHTWENIDSAGPLEYEQTVTPYTTNRYVFTAFYDDVTNTVAGIFLSRVYNEWFTARFVDGAVECDGEWTQPGEGAVRISVTNGLDACVLEGADAIIYTPSRTSEEGASVDLTGKVMVAPSGVEPEVSEEYNAGLYFAAGNPITVCGYGAAGWTELTGAPLLTEGEWVDYRIAYDFDSSNIIYSVKNAELSPRLQLKSSATMISGVCFRGSGAISDFRGGYMATIPLGPRFPDGYEPLLGGVNGGMSFVPAASIDKNPTYSLTIVNPIKDAYYAVLVSEHLEGPYKPEFVRQHTDGSGTITLSFEADTPSKFAKILVSLSAIEITE